MGATTLHLQFTKGRDKLNSLQIRPVHGALVGVAPVEGRESRWLANVRRNGMNSQWTLPLIHGTRGVLGRSHRYPTDRFRVYRLSKDACLTSRGSSCAYPGSFSSSVVAGSWPTDYAKRHCVSRA